MIANPVVVAMVFGAFLKQWTRRESGVYGFLKEAQRSRPW